MHGTRGERDGMARARGRSLGVLLPQPSASPTLLIYLQLQVQRGVEGHVSR